MNKKIFPLMLSLMLALCSCSVSKFNKTQTDALEGSQVPVLEESPYANPLRNLGGYLKKIDKSIVYVGVGQIANLTPGVIDIPYLYQTYLELSMNKLGPQILCVPGPVRPVVITDNKTGRQITTEIPYISVQGALLSYDKNISSEDRGGGLDFHIGGGETETDGGIDGFEGVWLESATIGLQILDHKKGSIFLPGMNITMSVKLLRLSRQGGLGLEIYGNGLRWQERRSIGTPRGVAMLSLIDASIFYLFCNYFNLNPNQFIDAEKLSQHLKQNLERDLNPVEDAVYRKNGIPWSSELPADLDPSEMHKGQDKQDKALDSDSFTDDYENYFNDKKRYKFSKFRFQED